MKSSKTNRVSKMATSWWLGWVSSLGFTANCHLQKLASVLSAWWLISRFGCYTTRKTHFTRRNISPNIQLDRLVTPTSAQTEHTNIVSVQHHSAQKYKKLIRRWDSERKLSLRQQRIRTTK